MRFFIVFSVLIPSLCFAQFTDNFSDGNFTNNPTWLGNTDKFIVNGDNELQLFENPQAAGTSYLSTSSGSIYDASWEFLVRFTFNPSSTNYCDVYLTSNTSNLTSVTNGYFVRIGNTADEVSLYRKNPTNSSMIIDGTDGRLNSTAVNVRIKVTRDFDGNWTLMSDTLGGFNYYTEGSVFDDTYYSSAYFGVSCVYTSTRSQHMFFDDFIVTGDVFVDDTPPVLMSYEIIDNQSILLVFNEELNPATALNTDNYLVNGSIGNPNSASFYEDNQMQVLLEFNNSFLSPNQYILSYQGITDLSGNEIETGSFNFFYIEFEPGMIVINEIMADPDPPVGLPNAEYVELFNTTDYTIDITGWVYKLGTSSRTLPSYQMTAGEFLIICPVNFQEDFSEYGNVIALESFPLITNSGQTITLFDKNENIIDIVSYSDTWYRDSNKKDGGWSLEKIDPTNTCSPATNWIASNSETGGTPGAINSVYAENSDEDPPYVIGVNIQSANELNVVFSEPTDTITSLVVWNYSLSPDFGNPFYAIQNPANPNAILIQFPASLVENVEYTLKVENISDLCGNTMETQFVDFILYTPNPYDVVISEIMADPEPVVLLPDAEYIELYNRSNYALILENWTFSAGTTTRTLPYCRIEAGGYLMICHENKVDLFDFVEKKVGISSFQALTNGGANLVLRDNTGKVIHTVTYSDTWYQDNFKKNGGYSLEMIDLNNPCEGIENWIASNDISGGTPGRQNSVFGINPDATSPYPIAAEAFGTDSLTVYFNEILKFEFANDPNSYFVEELGNPVWVSASEPSYNVITMKFNQEFIRGKVYMLECSQTIVDCSGNGLSQNTEIRFAIPDSAEYGDIAINEILFNPHPYGEDFLEIYNKSTRTLDLKLLWLSDKNTDVIGNSYQVSTISRLLLPGEYCAITTDVQDIMDRYYTPYPENLFETSNLPSMPDDAATVILTDRFLNVIDEVSYHKDQQYKLLVSQDGVSLERINYNRPSDDLSNWHSASQTVGFATPGYQNSQYSSEINPTSTITLSPEVFSPDNDGFDDRLNIIYSLDQPGYTATMAIYNSSGKFITYILNNELLGMEGILFWDGFDNANNACPIGIYVLYVEMFNLTGNKIVEKHAIVLSRKAF